ncbi:MAG TPA: hypothetical protein VGP02_03390 [Mycobacteriales bacterium]|nr:hypothetical protein [Mycobacteriales bacterium]
MYSWLWGLFPGGVVGKAICSVALVGAVAALLWYVVFPWVDPLLPFSDVTVGGTG